jgi:hypothetical protein
MYMYTMEDITSAILYGRLPIELPTGLTLRQQLSILRTILKNPASRTRVIVPPDFHPWTLLLLRRSFARLP